jgi:hypothetical protein
MLRAVHIFSSVCLSAALLGCSTLGPDPSIHVDGDSSLTWNDVREIERLLPVLGISRPIDGISMEGPDRAKVRCLVRPLSLEHENEAITFTVVRRNGRWVPVDKPSRGLFLFTA